MKLEILYQDQDIVAVNKPAGLLVHRSMLDSRETQFALQIVRDQIGAHVYPVHRLDKPTSGVLVFALSSEAAKNLSQEFVEHRVHKEYLAIVRGIPLDSQKIDHPLKEKLDKISDKKTKTDKPAQSAITVVNKLASIELPIEVDKYPTTRYSLVQAIPQTGRKHQIRRHLKYVNHPIIGDVEHGITKHNRFFEIQFDKRRLYLACTKMSFKHPMTQEPLEIKAHLSEDFVEVLVKFGWEEHAVY